MKDITQSINEKLIRNINKDELKWALDTCYKKLLKDQPDDYTKIKDNGLSAVRFMYDILKEEFYDMK